MLEKFGSEAIGKTHSPGAPTPVHPQGFYGYPNIVDETTALDQLLNQYHNTLICIARTGYDLYALLDRICGSSIHESMNVKVIGWEIRVMDTTEIQNWILHNAKLPYVIALLRIQHLAHSLMDSTSFFVDLLKKQTYGEKEV